MTIVMPTLQDITVTLMLEPQESGRFIASVMEFPACRVEADSREAAIALVHQQWQTQIKRAEFMPLSLPLRMTNSVVNPLGQLFGLYKDEPAFEDVVAIIQAERDALGDEPIDPGFYSPRETQA
jgi:predicted RNase H-like HicB family nuclease